MSTRDWIEVGASLAGGAGIGAALMYLFDPQLGDERREQLTESANGLASSAGEALGGAWESVSDRSKDAGSGLSSHAASLASAAKNYLMSAQDSAGDAAQGYWKSARRSANRAGSSTGDWFSDTGRSASNWVRSHAPRQEHHSTLGLTAGAVGALAFGAGLMFLLDPGQGRRRRAMMRDKAYGAARQSSDYVQRQGRALADKAGEWAQDAQNYATQAKDKIAGAVGKGEDAGQTGGTAISQGTTPASSQTTSGI